MESTRDSDATVLGAQFWSNLGIKYDEAYGQDEGLVKLCRSGSASFLQRQRCAIVVVVLASLLLAPLQMADIIIMASTSHPAWLPFAGSRSRKDLTRSWIWLTMSVDYDGVVASLSHFELSPQQHVDLTRKWATWVKPGGFILLSTLSGEKAFGKARSFDPVSGCHVGIETTFLGNRIILNMFTEKGWRKLLEDASFEIVRTETNMFHPKAEDAPEEPRYYIIAKKPSAA